MVNDETVTRGEISKRVSDETQIPREKASELLEQVIDLIRKELASGESVHIVRFGKFLLREKNARVGRNPKTGEAASIAERKVVTFKASHLLRDRISQSCSGEDGMQ